MYCIFARESLDKMGGNRGKLAAQAGHAFVGLMENAGAELWPRGLPKIVLVVETVADLIALDEEYSRNKCGTRLVTDAARTVFSEPTITCLGIGPLSDSLVGEDIRALRPLL